MRCLRRAEGHSGAHHPQRGRRRLGAVRRLQTALTRWNAECCPASKLTRRDARISGYPTPSVKLKRRAIENAFGRESPMALDYAGAVNAEIKDLFAAGADIVQIDEPYMQARPEKARQYGLAGLDAALDGVTGTTAIHICFGYAAIIHVRPAGYSFLPELAA